MLKTDANGLNCRQFFECRQYPTQRVGNYLPFRPFASALITAIYKLAKFLMQLLQPSTTIEFTELKAH